MSKSTLVIHPKDKSTDFLSEIYIDKSWTIINTSISKKSLKNYIKSHDRIVMLGHGTECGLIGFGNFIIDSRIVYLLREKECICIWCNADVFFKKYKLTGFYTGMIVSEVDEAVMYNLPTNSYMISESNLKFSLAIKESIDSDNILDNVRQMYRSDGVNNIIEFNRTNIYASESGVLGFDNN